jgi:hypothetical protein
VENRGVIANEKMPERSPTFDSEVPRGSVERPGAWVRKGSKDNAGFGQGLFGILGWPR